MAAKKLNYDTKFLTTELRYADPMTICSIQVSIWINCYGNSVINHIEDHLLNRYVFPELKRHFENMDITYGPEVLADYYALYMRATCQDL